MYGLNLCTMFQRKSKNWLNNQGRIFTGTMGGKSLHHESHGEAFRAMVFNRFRGKGLYILDEPEAALSPVSQLALLRKMKQLVEEDSQFIIATHSPIIMAYPEARIFEFYEKGIRPVKYTDTDHYCITKAFLSNPGKMLQDIFRDDD